VRQRQDRRASLSATPTELYLAAGTRTTVLLNGLLDRDSLVVDRTRFKWVDVGDQMLFLQLVADLGPGERLVIKIGFKDRALPAQAVFVAVTSPTVVDDNVEVDRRANTPEALLAALTQKEAELDELKVRCEGSGLTGLALSGWINEKTQVIRLVKAGLPGETSGLEVKQISGYQGTSSALVVIALRNLSGQPLWVLGQARITNAAGASVSVLSAQMKPPHLAPGEEGLLALDAKVVQWQRGEVFGLELVDAGGQRRLSFNLQRQ
jgi:uncharacterized protein (TIGR02268 family)